MIGKGLQKSVAPFFFIYFEMRGNVGENEDRCAGRLQRIK